MGFLTKLLSVAGIEIVDDDEPVTAEAGVLEYDDDPYPWNADTEINPATGMPMVGGMGGIDIEGNAFGVSSHNDSFDAFDSFGGGCGGGGLDDF